MTDTSAEQQIAALVASYIESINAANPALGATIWATTPAVSFIHPRGTERGWKEIATNFYEATMGATFTERTLRLVSELSNRDGPRLLSGPLLNDCFVLFDLPSVDFAIEHDSLVQCVVCMPGFSSRKVSAVPGVAARCSGLCWIRTADVITLSGEGDDDERGTADVRVRPDWSRPPRTKSVPQRRTERPANVWGADGRLQLDFGDGKFSRNERIPIRHAEPEAITTEV